MRLSLEDAADGICSVGYLSLIENGLRNPSLKIADKLNARYGLDTPKSLPEMSDFRIKTELELAFRLGKTDDVDELIASIQNPHSRSLFWSKLLEHKGDLHTAREVLESLLSASDIADSDVLDGAIVLTRVLRDLGYLKKAAAVAEEAIRRFQWNRDVPCSTEMLELVATASGIHCELGNLTRALDLVPELSNLTNNSSWDQAMAMWSGAMANKAAGNYLEASKLTTQALALLQEDDQPIAVASLLETDAFLKIQSGEYSKNKVSANLSYAIEVFQRNKMHGHAAQCLSTQSILAVTEKDFEEAISISELARATCPQQENGTMALILARSAGVYFEAGRFSESKLLLLEARELLENSGASGAEAQVWRLLSAIYEEFEDSVSALACLKAANELSHYETLVPAHRRTMFTY
jgi:tetratricopeptide (TPR) repeat protein